MPEKQPIEKLKQSVVTCFYCMKRDHSVRFCKIRNFSVPKGVMMWVPKNYEVPNDKDNAKGYTFVRGPNLVARFHGFAGFLRDQGLLSQKIKLMKGKDSSELPITDLYHTQSSWKSKEFS